MPDPEFGSDAHDDLVNEGDTDAVNDAINAEEDRQAAEDADNNSHKDKDEDD